MREVIWYQNVYVYVNSSGHVYWKIRSDYSVTCGLDMTYFPFDTQTCSIDVATQELSTFDANLTNGKRNSRFLPSPTKLRQGNVFTRVCHSIHTGACLPDTPLGRNPLMQTPPGKHPPWVDTPHGDTPVTATGMHSCKYNFRTNQFGFRSSLMSAKKGT